MKKRLRSGCRQKCARKAHIIVGGQFHSRLVSLLHATVSLTEELIASLCENGLDGGHQLHELDVPLQAGPDVLFKDVLETLDQALSGPVQNKRQETVNTVVDAKGVLFGVFDAIRVKKIDRRRFMSTRQEVRRIGWEDLAHDKSPKLLAETVAGVFRENWFSLIS